VSLLVGSLIQSARVALPDRPGTLPAPTASFAVVTATGSTLPAGTYLTIATQFNPWGETLGSTESGNLVVGANQGIQVTSALLPGAIKTRCYLTLAGGTTGTEQQFVESTSSPFTISAPPVNAGVPPSRNTAYNPDTDGAAVSASQMYHWLNNGLTRLSRLVGGVLDYSGVGTVPGQPYYVVTGEWLDIPNVWYNGWWVQGADPGGFFKRNAVLTGILSRVAVSIFDDRCILEVSYQPDRQAGSTTTTGPNMGLTDTSVGVTSTSAFLLPNGFCQIGTEICAYSGLSGGKLNGLIRRLGGTSAVAWASGTTVQELNLFFQGKRILSFGFVPGQSQTVIPVPEGWSDLLTSYIVARFRGARQEYDEEEKRLASFDRACRDWALNKPVEKHVQVGGSRTPLTYQRSVAGGIIIP
jgi:hypothetical protein